MLTQCLCTFLLDLQCTCPPFLIHCGLGQQMFSKSIENGLYVSCFHYPFSFSERKWEKHSLHSTTKGKHTNSYPHGGLHQHTHLSHSGTQSVHALVGSFPNEDHKKSWATWKAAISQNFLIIQLNKEIHWSTWKIIRTKMLLPSVRSTQESSRELHLGLKRKDTVQLL